MNYLLLFRVLGLLVLLIGGSLVLCEVYGYFLDRDHPQFTPSFALLKTALVAFGVGGTLFWIGRGGRTEILRKEAIAIVGLGWMLCTVIGALPYMLSQPGLPPAAAFFESAAGFTTTGSTVIADLTAFPPSILLWRAATQWLGGMGILVLFVALLASLGVGSKSIFRHESTTHLGYGFHSRIRQTALRMWQIYLGLTAVCLVGLMALGMSFYDALLHAFTTVSTGGFSTRNESIAYYQSAAIDAWLCVFMLIGGTSFLLIAWVLRGNLRRMLRDEEFRTYLLIIGFATAAVTVDLWLRQDLSLARSLQLGAFQVISIMTTTGYATADYSAWPTFSVALLVLLMFVGGCSGSTSGSIKVSRFLVLVKATGQQLVNAFRPNQIVPLRLSGQILDESEKVAALFFVALMCFLVGISTMIVNVMEPRLDLGTGFTAVCATLLNIGPGLGTVGPVGNFGFLSPPTHVFLGLLMLLGRLELFALLVLFLPALWRRY